VFGKLGGHNTRLQRDKTNWPVYHHNPKFVLSPYEDTNGGRIGIKVAGCERTTVLDRGPNLTRKSNGPLNTTLIESEARFYESYRRTIVVKKGNCNYATAGRRYGSIHLAVSYVRFITISHNLRRGHAITVRSISIIAERRRTRGKIVFKRLNET